MQKVQMEALAYIRGRSIMNQYVIVDECQYISIKRHVANDMCRNLTPHEMKTIISRCGEGTKMVLTGDPYQIDNPCIYLLQLICINILIDLDANSNGLSYCVEKLKKIWLHGHVTMQKSERSALAAAAAELL
jgi:PhoH-like ATPase